MHWARVLLAGVLAGCAADAGAWAQTASPALHTRHDRQEDAQHTPVAATGHTDLPPGAEGEYPTDKHGSEIEVYFESGKLYGYMTEQVDPNRHVAPLTFDFKTTHADGHALAWTTDVVHGVSYSFAGHLERGTVASPSLPGYYVLTGTLTEHGGQTDGQALTVSLKREPGQP